MEKSVNTYLFSYRFGGKQYGFDIMAASEEEAMARLYAIRFASYDGVLVARIPAKLGFIARALVFFGNFFRLGRSK